MVGIDPNNKKYIITFKRKDERPNQRDDKFEIFRNVTGLSDIRDILDLRKHSGPTHMHDPIIKTPYTVTDINAYENPTIHARLNEDQANRLRKDPNVLFVQEDYVAHITDTVSWQWDELGAGKSMVAPLSAAGQGVNVAVIDTGVDATHIDLKDRVKLNQNFVTDNLGFKGGNEHGTHVSGIIAATANGEGTIGIAPLANIWNLRVGAADGSMQGTDIGEALDYCNANKPHIINMSLGGMAGTPALDAWITTNLHDMGVLLFGSAGNSGQQILEYPGAFTNVNGVTALQEAHIIADFSTWNNQVDFTAPGTNIISCGYNNRLWGTQGTSMSCPAVAGVAAVSLSAFREGACGEPYTPGASKVSIIEQVMRQSAVKQTSSGMLTGAAPRGTRDIFYGWGMPLAHICAAALKGVTAPAQVATISPTSI